MNERHVPVEVDENDQVREVGIRKIYPKSETREYAEILGGIILVAVMLGAISLAIFSPLILIVWLVLQAL